MCKSVLAIVATYNERENLQSLTEALLATCPPIDILVVDDNSPDETGLFADSLAQRVARLKVLHRERKDGLRLALYAGFNWALQMGYDCVINLDGDLSHSPTEIPLLLEVARKADLVLGSRYVNGIRVINWTPRRLILSLLAARYVRLVTGMPFQDPTSGFRCFRRAALEGILNFPPLSIGYSIHIEMAYKAWQLGLKISEVPIFYTDRQKGHTKLNKRIILEALWVTLRLGLQGREYRKPNQIAIEAARSSTL